MRGTLSGMRTLCIDVGGTGIKGMVLNGKGTPATERVRIETPNPATPDAVVAVIQVIATQLGKFDRISVGFPGVVSGGVTRTAPNLGPGWGEFALADAVATALGKPVRAANDAGVQGLGVIEGTGVEMVITLGTGMGFGLYVDGRYVPNIEMAHHPYRRKRTYEERIGNAARKRVGNARWNTRVTEVIAQLAPIFNYRVLYLGGGNAKFLDSAALPANVRIVDNAAGILGGVKLWE